jgi:hypothetical protein
MVDGRDIGVRDDSFVKIDDEDFFIAVFSL